MLFVYPVSIFQFPTAMAATAFFLSIPRLHPHRLSRTQTLTTFSKTLSRNLSTKTPIPTSAFPNFAPPDQESQPPHPPPAEPKSFNMVTAELLLGIAWRLIKTFKGRPSPSAVSVPIWGSSNDVDSGKEKIGGFVEDSLEGVVWEQIVKDVEAEKCRNKVTSPGFSFSAAGLLFPYHLGVAHFLIENGYIKDTTPLAGSSAGAIICAVIASGSSMQEALQVTKQLAQDCRVKGTAFRLGAVLREILEEFLPDDVHTRCNGRVRIAVTQILWTPRGLLVDQFDSKEDLINAIFTSSFIPGYLAPRPATLFRNRLCIDGGFFLFIPPTSAAKTVRVCALPATTLRMEEIGISPDCSPENRPGTRQLFNWALEPAEDHVLDKLFEFGYTDASVWAEANPVDTVVKEDELSVG